MKFKIVSSNLPNPIEIESEAITWGEFKKDLAKHDINTSNMCGIVRSTHNTLEVDDAVLPHNTDVEIIFLVPNKMESGADEHIPGARVGETREEYNARRRKEYAEKKKKNNNDTKCCKKQEVKQNINNDDEPVNKMIESIADEITKVSNDLNKLILKLHCISNDIKELSKCLDKTEKLKDELNTLTRQLSEVRRYTESDS